MHTDAWVPKDCHYRVACHTQRVSKCENEQCGFNLLNFCLEFLPSEQSPHCVSQLKAGAGHCQNNDSEVGGHRAVFNPNWDFLPKTDHGLDADDNKEKRNEQSIVKSRFSVDFVA